MKITLRLIVSLLLAAAIVASVFSYLQIQNERDRLLQELDVHAGILADDLQEPVREILRTKSPEPLQQIVDRFRNRDNLTGVGVYDNTGALIASSPGMGRDIHGTPACVLEAINREERVTGLATENDRKKHLYATPLRLDGAPVGALLLRYDVTYIDARLNGIWQSNFIPLLTQALVLILTTVIVVRWSITGPIANIAKWMRGLRTGKPGQPPPFQIRRGDILRPLTEEVQLMARSLTTARSAAEKEARLRVEAESLWTAERLKEHVRQQLGGKNLIVVSNREPYMHVRQGSAVECIVPPGGLVTAIDPIMQACGGVWIAQGSGEADRETSDAKGRLPVPPEEPRYTLRRVFISKEEEEGYYFGFSNEGIWPLCHITHTRPLFRLDDWLDYQNVNQKFADAVLDQISDESEPLILVQDYHFALLPLLIKSKRPDARVAIFWHIPWPNPEIFGICPWKQEILLGLLGADLIGFHIQFHCNNFLETVDRYLESKINWDQFTVEKLGSTTAVKPFPISVAFPGLVDGVREIVAKPPDIRNVVHMKTGSVPRYLAVGVDRIDYTKGIVERLKAVERFLEKYPEYVGQFTFVELGAPSRTHIKRYLDLMAEVEGTVEAINWRFRQRDWKPIVFLKGHHNHVTIEPFYKAAQVCMVTSLHDGMNLVAKEFIAARDDEDGVLILSQFTGASRELQDAMIINPYDVEEVAEAIHTALVMPRTERTERMQRMRAVVRDRNVYRWAGNIISSLSRLRLPKQPAENSSEPS